MLIVSETLLDQLRQLAESAYPTPVQGQLLGHSVGGSAQVYVLEIADVNATTSTLPVIGYFESRSVEDSKPSLSPSNENASYLTLNLTDGRVDQSRSWLRHQGEFIQQELYIDKQQPRNNRS